MGWGAWGAGSASCRCACSWPGNTSRARRITFNGKNWFAGIRQQFPWPFDLPPALNWQLAAWAEPLGGALLFPGLATRLVVVSIGLTRVASCVVHLPDVWPGLLALHEGHAIRDTGQGDFKLPLRFLAMSVPLLCFGPGRLSLDGGLVARIARWVVR